MSRLDLDDSLVPRPDAAAKLGGTLRYLTDLAPPDALHGAVLRSPHPHARIRSIDTSAAEAAAGVVAVVTHRDVAPGFRLGLSHKDQPPLAVDRVRYVGEAVAAVAAETIGQARAAAALIRVDYEILPVVNDPEAALGPDAVALHPGGNLCHRTFHAHGDLAAAFAAAAHVVEDTYATPRQMHAALELEGGLAVPTADGRLVVHAPAQHPHGVRDVLAALLDWPAERVDVVGSPIGGGFGGKEDLHVQPIAALLARAAGRPVRLAWTRPEAVAAGVKRHPFTIRMRTACDAAGRLLAQDVRAVADTGAYATHGPEVLDTAHENAQGPYLFPAARAEGLLAYTNNGVSGAFRGFGALQMQVAMELQIERLARAVGMDPVAFRRMNLRPADARGALDQSVLPQPELAVVAERLATHPLRARRPDAGGRYLHGSGVALVSKGEGFGGGRPKLGSEEDVGAGGPNAAAGILALAGHGIEFRCGLAEMGQGVLAAMAAALARELGVDRADVRALAGSTEGLPDAGPTSASRGTQVAVRLARIGSPALRRAILDRAAKVLDVPADRLALGPGGVHFADSRRNAPAVEFARLSAPPVLVPVTMPPIETADGTGAAHKVFTTCGAVARVAVDRATGRILAERIAVIPACGPVLVPDAFLGQVEGGAVMAAGFVLTEDLPARDGRFTAANLDRYLVPTVLDAPRVDVEPVEELAPDDPIGLRGVGEIPMNAVGPAIAAAIFDALGAAPTRYPVSPAWVLDRLDRREAQEARP